MPVAADLRALIAPGTEAPEDDPKDVLFDAVYARLRRDYFVPQSYLEQLIDIYCRWNEAFGKEACVAEARRIIDLAVEDFMAFVPLKKRNAPRLEP